MIIAVWIITFISEYLDSGLGMGYGTALAPLLILLGFEPAQVVPAVLISQLLTDIAACVVHHNFHNVDLKIYSKDFKIALIMGVVSSLGVFFSVLIALRIPAWVLTLYIGVLVLGMGVVILLTRNKNIRFSWGKILGISFLAAFNKGISGGGYGPLVMGGQVLSGVKANNAVGITAFAEAVTCLVGFIVYVLHGKNIEWRLIGLLVIAALPAVPIAALTVKYIPSEKLREYVGGFIMLLGALTLLKIR
ncbi:MAG TPA: sulfite exporter TauE/SafE family protein [Candidatus Omnitrophota bacterium]|nr:sulfite exporter TauE/SafE family protein [Candidatus Omnitrophota bacterium]